MPRVSLKGAGDMHIHSAPSLFERMCDDVEMASMARDAGMAVIMLKNHHESTVSRAYHTQKQVPDIKIFGGLVLNRFVGGINPLAAEAALKMGAKQIWMPTFNSAAHTKIYGGATYGYQETGLNLIAEPISVIKDGKLIDEAIKIIELVKKYDAILGTAHLSKEEIFLLVKKSREMDLNKIVVTHPFFKPPDLSIDDLKELLKLGAIFEFVAGDIYPIPGYGKIDVFRDAIKEIGAKNIVISSDAGQLRKSPPPETIRVFVQCLFEKGISMKDLEIMMVENYKWLLNLD